MTPEDLLPEFQNFLLTHALIPGKSIPFYALWASRFLTFSNKSEHKDVKALISEFLESLTTKRNVADWQVRQAEEALRLYCDHYSGGKTLKEIGEGEKDFSGQHAILEAVRTLIRIKHYSYSTERTYLDWAKRFFSYMEESRGKGRASTFTQDDVRNYLSHLALKQRVSSSTQNQAFNALLFLVRDVLLARMQQSGWRHPGQTRQ